MVNKHEYVRRITTNILQKYCYCLYRINPLEDYTDFNDFNDDVFISEIDKIVTRKEIFDDYFLEGKSQQKIAEEHSKTPVRIQQILSKDRLAILKRSKEFSKILSEVLANARERFYRYCLWKYNDRIELNPTVLYTHDGGYVKEHLFFDKLYTDNYKKLEENDCPIQDAGFSVRAYNMLGINGIFREGIRTLSQLVESKSLRDISKMRGAGPSLIKEITTVLKQHDFTLKGDGHGE